MPLSLVTFAIRRCRTGDLLPLTSTRQGQDRREQRDQGKTPSTASTRAQGKESESGSAGWVVLDEVLVSLDGRTLEVDEDVLVELVGALEDEDADESPVGVSGA